MTNPSQPSPPEDTPTPPDPCAGGHPLTPDWVGGVYVYRCANPGCGHTEQG